MMKVNIISKKLIKPRTLTPQNLNKYKLSLIDELIPPEFMNVTLFYPPNPNPTINQLQESLSDILPQFYPLAGRYMKKDHLVDCNDEGAEFVEAEANDIELIDFIAQSKNVDHLDNPLSRHPYDMDKPNDPLLSIQITKFKCGGLSISISLSHRISDVSSLGTLITAWSNAHHNNNNQEPIMIIPTFDSPSLFPGTNLECDFEPPHKVALKRLLFNKEVISSLRDKLRPNKNGNGYLSRVRVVSAVIAKALIRVELAKRGKSRVCYIGQAVNMRSRTIPRLHEHLNGNLVVEAVTKCMDANESKEKGLQELVYLLGDVIEKTIIDCEKLLSLDEDGRKRILRDPLLKMYEILSNGDGVAMWFTDWSKFGFYKAEFGSGSKPIWVRVGNVCTENVTIFVENKEGDGIEAWVHLDPCDVPYFEVDEDMKLFTIA
ncbi:hypothetical protein CASFOL_012403 [Castilleja foliolosa]|uniref:Uncharacterized protein n=1 Tax=Castilleja foliolosa TaxID=1961234 RepID=A0ABD3DH65_9LAMI